LIACGTVHETFASFPASQLERISSLQRDDRPLAFEMTLSHGARELGEARRNRNVQLDLAREYFDRALKLDPSSTEARLRLAQVRLQRKDETTAANILDTLLAGSSLEARERYLAILFLSRIRERQNRLDDAAALLKLAAVHQTSLIAGAHNAQRRGDPKEATTIVDRMTRLGTDDPWWSYRFGQYWLVKSLFKELREEAVK
jgi:predicted Zn-dependent protease